MFRTLRRLKEATALNFTLKKPPSKFRPVRTTDDKNIEDDDEKPEFTPFVVKKHPPEYYRDLCKRFASEGKIAEAVAVVEKRMYEDRVKPEKFNYITVVHILAKAGQARKAMDFFKKMRTAGFEPGPHTVTSLMNACANAAPQDAEFALRQTSYLYERVRRMYGVPNTPAIYFAAMKCYARHGDVKAVFRLADQMIEDGWYVGTRIFAYLLSAAVSDKEAGFQLALRIWESMMALKRKPTIFHYQLLIRACRDAGIGEKGNELLKSIAESRRKEEFSGKFRAKNDDQKLIRPGKVENLTRLSIIEHKNEQQRLVENDDQSDSSVNAQLDSVVNDQSDSIVNYQSDSTVNDCALANPEAVTSSGVVTERQIKLGLIGGVSGLFERMRKDGVSPDSKLFSILLYLIPSNCESESELIEYARKGGIRLDTNFYNKLIFRRAVRCDREMALACLDDLRKARLKPDQKTFAALAVSCTRNDDGLTLLRDMKNLNMKPEIPVFEKLISQALYRHQFLYARNVLSQMLKFGTKPDERFLLLIENRLEETRRILIKQKASNDGASICPVFGFEKFSAYYETWLEQVGVSRTVDPRLTLLDRQVNADDLREDWEKPWIEQERSKAEKEALGNIEIVP